MTTPQQPELRRSEQTPTLSTDAIEGHLDAHDRPDAERPKGHVPEENRPGTTSGPVQDKPDLDAMAARLGTDRETRGSGAHDVAATVLGYVGGTLQWVRDRVASWSR